MEKSCTIAFVPPRPYAPLSPRLSAARSPVSKSAPAPSPARRAPGRLVTYSLFLIMPPGLIAVWVLAGLVSAVLGADRLFKSLVRQVGFLRCAARGWLALAEDRLEGAWGLIWSSFDNC